MTHHERPDPADDAPGDRRRKNITVVRIQMVREGGFSFHAGPVRNSADGAEIFQAYLAGARPGILSGAHAGSEKSGQRPACSFHWITDHDDRPPERGLQAGGDFECGFHHSRA